MAKGTTISITLPNPLLNSLKKESEKKGMMRSRFIVNILSRWQEEQEEKNPKKEENPKREERQEKPKREVETKTKREVNNTPAPHDCPNRKSNGFCSEFQYICNVPQEKADNCAGYP